MEKIKNFYNKYVNYIVILLLILFLGKGCQSCVRQRAIDKSVQTNIELSLKMTDTINYYNSKINNINDTLILYKIGYENLNTQNQELQKLMNHFKNTNSVLIKTNSQLTNEENKK